jgi:hypothetical protein
MSLLQRLFRRSEQFNILPQNRQERVLGFIKKLIEFDIKTAESGFHPEFLSKLCKITEKDAFKYLIYGYHASVFELNYEIRCNDCDEFIKRFSAEADQSILEDSDDFFPPEECPDYNENCPVHKGIDFNQIIPFFKLKKGVIDE